MTLLVGAAPQGARFYMVVVTMKEDGVTPDLWSEPYEFTVGS